MAGSSAGIRLGTSKRSSAVVFLFLRSAPVAKILNFFVFLWVAVYLVSTAAPTVLVVTVIAIVIVTIDNNSNNNNNNNSNNSSSTILLL